LTVNRPYPRFASHLSAGYSLVELMVVLAIALFLLGGLLTIVESTRSTFTSQTALAKLQDSESLAMTLMTDVIEQSGYYPNPTSNTIDSALPAVAAVGAAPSYAPAFAAEQAIYGTSGASAPGDTFSVRYMTNDDTVMNCLGGTNSTTSNVTYTNTFWVDGSGNLNCTLTTIVSGGGTSQTTAALVSGIQNLQVWYGVRTNSGVTDNNVDTYLTAAQMTNADWSNVTCVKVRITFVNPLSTQGIGGATTSYVESVIGVMSRTGVTT
jgi:type IV pilus assembly protein PilW